MPKNNVDTPSSDVLKDQPVKLKRIFSASNFTTFLFLIILICAGVYLLATNQSSATPVAVSNGDFGCNGAPNTLPVLVLDSTGKCVEYAQSMLNRLVKNGIKVDGVFGSTTYTAVVIFQKQHDLAVDGKIGPQTWSALYSAY